MTKESQLRDIIEQAAKFIHLISVCLFVCFFPVVASSQGGLHFALTH